jgi:hypothetical protein
MVLEPVLCPTCQSIDVGRHGHTAEADEMWSFVEIDPLPRLKARGSGSKTSAPIGLLKVRIFIRHCGFLQHRAMPSLRAACSTAAATAAATRSSKTEGIMCSRVSS